jgi:glycosyltransferase involved in cell wall biosynthesis
VKVAIDVSAIPAQPAGAGRYVERVVHALAASGAVDLELVTRRDDLARWQHLSREVHAVAPTRRPLRLVWEQFAGPGIASAADVWHGPHYTMPLLSRRPTVVTVHDLTFFDHPEWHEASKVRYFRWMIRQSARRANVLVCVSERTADRLHELVAPDVPVVVAPHGVDHARFSTGGESDGEDVDEVVGLEFPQPFVAFVGTIEPRKNVAGLVRAMSRLDRSVHLVLAGRPGWGSDDLDAVIAESGMANRVHRLGYVSDATVASLYRRAAAVAYPAYTEGFGLPALEALACGAALVTTERTPMADVVGDAALLIPPGDESALTDALRALLAGGADVERLRSRGPVVAAPYTWAASAARHVEAYRQAFES